MDFQTYIKPKRNEDISFRELGPKDYIIWDGFLISEYIENPRAQDCIIDSNGKRLPHNKIISLFKEFYVIRLFACKSGYPSYEIT